jgi:hypothetical protein
MRKRTREYAPTIEYGAHLMLRYNGNTLHIGGENLMGDYAASFVVLQQNMQQYPNITAGLLYGRNCCIMQYFCNNMQSVFCIDGREGGGRRIAI